ncbi:YigZ family protein [Lottiidibacillus patelloidae]|uniref:YigZ family protein n=1 Tax=Lottiidibacillus patelloidae TaxID=2670334 RepID=A0A263BS37_9BACI|nr:YigZ family protein [Lottiidibacillus patelloidae]OZM56514.1 YigZ family protein [Lottiidibacillus patelloidae]
MRNSYYTVKGLGQQEINIQKSRFIAYVNRATTEEEAQQFIQEIKKKHWDANHNCSAYCIGENNQIQKANDDGEPSGTAGIPILEVIKKRNLNDTVIVITRYFGGIKLGAGGLIRAYGKSASEGINTTGIVKRALMTVMETKVAYHWLGKVENELRATNNYLLKEIQYADDVIFKTYIEKGKEEVFSAWMIEMTNGQCQNSPGNVTYLEVPAED